MLTKWFGARSPRTPERDRYFRPQLECLEGRLAPSSFNGNGNGGDDNGGGDDVQRTPPGYQKHINNFDDFDENTNDQFQIILNSLTVNQFFFTASLPPGQLQQEFFFNLTQGLQGNSQANFGNAITLVSDEFQLAQDTSLLVSSILSGSAPNQSLILDIHNLQAAIQSNPLEATTGGPLAGALAFDFAFQASFAAHFNNGGQGH
jgi:hypothetical protein